MQLENDASFKVYGDIDISNIIKRLAELNESIWSLDVSRQAYGYGPHNKTNSIILNYCRGEPEIDKNMALGFNASKNTDGWNHSNLNNKSAKNLIQWHHRTFEHFLEDVKNIERRMVDEQLNSYTDVIVKELEKEFNGIAGLVLYAKLPSQSTIGEHVDGGHYLSVVHRLHIPIITNDKVDFLLTDNSSNTVKINMLPGVLYEINNQHRHKVQNLGNNDRIHLIIDIIPNDKIPY